MCYRSIFVIYNKFHIFSPLFLYNLSCFNYLLLLCIGLYSTFQLCKTKIIYCKWIERGYKYIFYVKSSNCTILSVSAVIYVIMLMYNLEINYLYTISSRTCQIGLPAPPPPPPPDPPKPFLCGVGGLPTYTTQNTSNTTYHCYVVLEAYRHTQHKIPPTRHTIVM